jgi:AcrR family transcriptional regulator
MRSSRSTKALSSREKVIRAATVLFAARGFQGTSTRDVAKRARVNPVTIFRRFKTKQELYLQVLDSRMGVSVREWLLPVLQSSTEPEEVFLSLAERLEELFDPIFLRLLSYAALEKPELLRKRYRPRLVSFYEILGTHIRERIDAEILRDVEPLLMGRALVGMIAHHRIVCELLGGDDFPGCDIAGSAKTYTDIWLFGVSAWGAPARQRQREERVG